MRDRRRKGGSQAGEVEVVVQQDGRVLIRPLTQEVLEVALALAPDSPELQARARMRDRRKKEGAP